MNWEDHEPRDKARQGVVASTLAINESGAIGFFDWLDVGSAITASVEVWADDQAEKNAQTHATDCQMCAVEKPKLPERKMGVVVRLVQRKIEARRSPCKNERSCKQETGAKPSRAIAIFSTKRRQNEERRNDSANCTGNNLVEVHRRLHLTRKK